MFPGFEVAQKFVFAKICIIIAADSPRPRCRNSLTQA